MHQRDDTSNEPDPWRTSANMATEPVPNAIPNNCDMATDLVPKEIENDHRAYRIAYRMASRETVKITTKRWSPRSHSNGYSTEAVYRWRREVDQEHTEAIIRMTFTEKQSTETLPDAEWKDAGIRICKEAFREQKRAPIAMQLAHSATLKWSPASHIWEPTAMTMPGGKAHIIAQSHDETPLQWRRDWAHWDASYDSKSRGRASQDRRWTAGDAEGRPKPKEDSLQMKRKPN